MINTATLINNKMPMDAPDVEQSVEGGLPHINGWHVQGELLTGHGDDQIENFKEMCPRMITALSSLAKAWAG